LGSALTNHLIAAPPAFIYRIATGFYGEAGYQVLDSAIFGDLRARR
jgi:hypothetical protein